MIDALRVAKTANFHSLKRPLSNASVDELFRRIRAGHPSASQNLFYHRRAQAGASFWSAVSFLYDRTPSFLSEEAGIRERICGFLLLVEHRDHVALFKSKLEVPAGFSTRYLGRISPERIDIAVARKDTIFEKIRLRNMSISKNVMRSKSFEADDLSNVVGPAGVNRYVPQGYTVRSDAGNYSTTPSTGRIGQRSDRVGHLALVEYATSVIDDLVGASGTPARFIGTFARAIDLASLQGSLRPTTFAVDVASLIDSVQERREIRFVRKVSDHYNALSKSETDKVMTELDCVLKVDGGAKLLDLVNSITAQKLGAIAVNKGRIALRDLTLPLSSAVEVEDSQHPLGGDPNRLSLRRYIDRENKFIVLFDSLSLAYIDGTLFRDDGFSEGGYALLRHVRANNLLNRVTDEKGTFTTAQTTFDTDSTFGVIERSVADGDEILICDDLGDEWADFIGLSNSSSPPRITFYHAKHGELSLGASQFHISVSQAIKNLQRMNLPPESMGNKIRGWKNQYANNGVKTKIPRTLRGNQGQLAAEFAHARSAPDVIRRVFIVTSSLSRKAVEDALARVKAGKAPDPYFVQLYWLLMSFFSACAEMNAHGYVICQD
ncbi:hypothetical protein [Bradyrhizobium lablabi]|uniref:hypothetical protein n=1 Tax=Bradyrhizobium lablabi TaxID=722472 RepID=UPI000A540017|nr:hypothetical protein [Bradyrhizobium lablabi]